MSGSKGAGRGYSWAPATKGNLLAVSHGAQSPRLVRQDAAELLAEVQAEEPSWLGQVDRAALDAWLYAEATCRRLREWLGDHGHIEEDGKPRAASQLLLQWERRAADQRSRLGFDPLSRARLGRDTAVAQAATVDALGAIAARGRAVVAVRVAELASAESDAADPGAPEDPGGAT